MRETHVPQYRRRYMGLVPTCIVSLIGAFVLYGFLGGGLWLFLLFPYLVVLFVIAAWRQASVRCPHCGRLVYEQEHGDEGRPRVFVCRRCDTRLITDILEAPGG